MWVCTKTCQWNKTTDHLKKLEMNYQTSCSIIYWNLYFNSLHKENAEKTKPKNPHKPPIPKSPSLSLQPFSYLCCYCPYFLSIFRNRKEYNTTGEEKAFQKKGSPPQVWYIPVLISDKRVSIRIADPQQKAQWSMSAQQKSPFCQRGT